MQILIFLMVAVIVIFIFAYRANTGGSVYKYIAANTGTIYEKYAPYSFQEIREKVKDLGQEYSKKQYTIQVTIFAVGSFVVTYLYFYNIIISLLYAGASILVIPYLTYLRCKRVYSEYIFEQVQVYTTNTIMEFATTQSFVKSIEGVYESGVLEDPMKTDVKIMIDMAYENGTIDASLEYLNQKYDYHIIRNMHQLFLQITNEGARNSGPALENMSLDIDMLVENVYSDRIDRAEFHKKFVRFGLILYLMVMLVQVLLTVETYLVMLDNILVVCLLHGIILVNTYFLLNGEKYYNENVGAE